MAAALARLPSGFFPHQLFFSLLALQYGSVNSQTNVKVTQEPPFDDPRQGDTLALKCSVNQDNYYFFWYHQVPEKTELKPLGTFNTFSEDLQEPAAELKERLSGKREGKVCYLNLVELQPSDRGLYLCAARDTVMLAGTDTDPECDRDQPSSPSALLLGPACHKKSTTLVCLVQGFSYKWPVDVRWKRDGQEVPGLSVATEEAKKKGKCSFGVASRLSVAAEEWKEGHTYSCHFSQGNIKADAEITSKRSQQTDTGIQHSLHVGQLIFLLLTVKSFAYGTVLGIYTVCRKTNL